MRYLIKIKEPGVDGRFFNFSNILKISTFNTNDDEQIPS
ncbi:hypothetical protein SAMN05444682_102111 [Parapedobacter indicus]|uniref:Uncharacterized protein n=1 Tax=Parapedobacter indicus TaxID=1477437 RepID=A0A1I3F214_9SPHI|nr:hypothetical protein CLV26_102111 [Parapedobacter indicus]SFI04821.1 hypothetical protein SAMN05444682_102111 [Parapedobacter indicus]